MNPNVELEQSTSNDRSSIILVKKDPHLEHYNDEGESYDDDDGEYEEDIEEGVPYHPEIDSNELYSKQSKNNRYARPQVILETVEQESDECKSSICDSTNYISQQKLFNKDKQGSKPPSLRYSSQNEKPNEVVNSVKIANKVLNQSPLQCKIRNERSEHRLKLSSESKTSKVSYENKNKLKNPTHIKGQSEVSVRLFGQQQSPRNYQNANIYNTKVSPNKPLKDITQMDNSNIQSRRMSAQQLKSKSNFASQKQRKVVHEVLNDYEDCHENEPVGYAKIDLMNNHHVESDTESIPYDQLNSKLSRIEDAVHFFYEKMNDNYTNCMHQVGNIKDFIEQKSEKKANSRMQSAYSNQASALKTPIQYNKFMDFNASSKKNTPADGLVEMGQHTSQSKGTNRLRFSRDATPEQEYTARNNFNKDKTRRVLSRNNSGYVNSKQGLYRYNSMMSQSTNSINNFPATRSFALHL
jgi:hypothetical protein